MKLIGEPSMAQLRREARDQRAIDCRARVVDAHARRAASMGRRLFPANAGLPAQVRAAVEAWCEAHRDPGATIEHAAAHEAGHFLAAVKLGLAPARADIRGTSGDPKGYGGTTMAWARPLDPEKLYPFTTDDAEREAVFTLAGPIAEWWLAGGHPYASPSEFLEVCMLAVYVADQREVSRIATLNRVFTLAAQVTLTFQDQIGRITAILKRRRTIFTHSKGMSKLFESIGGPFLTGFPSLTSEEDRALGNMMLGAPVDLASFTVKLGR